jgi:hypothetical protein
LDAKGNGSRLFSKNWHHDSDFDFAAVGHHFIDSISLFEKYYTVELVKAYEVKITSNAKDERCIGMIAIRLILSQGMTTMQQINKLKHLAQTAIFTEAYADSSAR